MSWLDWVLLLGRVLFGLLFFLSGVGHLTQSAMRDYAKSMGVPAAGVLVPLTGIQIILGSLMVVLGIWPDLGALLLFIFLVPTAFIMHRFWGLPDPMMSANQQAHFMKNIALAGGSLILFALLLKCADRLALVVTGPLFR